MKAKNSLTGSVVTGVIGEDVHIVGITVIEQALNAAGFKVHSLGAQVNAEEFVQAAIKVKADAILISSFSGHAESLVQSFRDKIKEAGLNAILYIGGYLLIREEPWEEVEKRFKDMGFDRVYPPGTSPTTVIEDLSRDMLLKRRQ